MRTKFVCQCVFLGCLLGSLSACFADFATPFVEIHNKPGDVSVSHARVAALGPEMGSTFLVIVMNDQTQPVVLWATAKKGVLKESLLGREVSIKAVITKAGSVTTKPEIEILQAEPLKTGVETGGAAERSQPFSTQTNRASGATGSDRGSLR
jgi:hypothetical protein